MATKVSQAHASKVGGELLKLIVAGGQGTLQKAGASDFQGERKALFIHGFMANADYMIPIMEDFTSAGFTALAYNYPCFDGIDTAAATLYGLLNIFDANSGQAIQAQRLVVVGHSMGGLVARALVTLEPGEKFVRKVLTLGTPHDGTLGERKALGWLVAAGEALTGVALGGYSYSGRSARQLMRQDTPSPYLDRLNSQVPAGSVDFHSFSGGLPYLTIGKNWFVERVLNFEIQRHFDGTENDGLVAETSSNLAGPKFQHCANGCVHHRNYVEFPKINHTHLCRNQTLNQLVLSMA